MRGRYQIAILFSIVVFFITPLVSPFEIVFEDMSSAGTRQVYVVINQSVSQANTLHRFSSGGTNDAQLSRSIPKSGSIEIDLGNLNELPPQWQGIVTVYSDQPITGTVLIATPTPTSTPTPISVYLPVVLKPLPVPTQTPTPTATNTPTPVPTATSPPTVTPTPTITPVSGQNIQCQQFGADQLCGWVSNGTPAQNSTVVVYGRYLVNGVGQGGLGMTTVWHYKSTTPSCSGSTQATGIASCARDIGRATLGYKVQVDVAINGHEVQTWFTPQ